MVDDEEEGGQRAGQGRTPEQRLPGDHEQYAADHRVAHVAIGAGDDEALRGIPGHDRPPAAAGEQRHAPDEQRQPDQHGGYPHQPRRPQPRRAGRPTGVVLGQDVADEPEGDDADDDDGGDQAGEEAEEQVHVSQRVDDTNSTKR